MNKKVFVVLFVLIILVIILVFANKKTQDNEENLPENSSIISEELKQIDIDRENRRQEFQNMVTPSQLKGKRNINEFQNQKSGSEIDDSSSLTLESDSMIDSNNEKVPKTDDKSTSSSTRGDENSENY